MPLYALTPPQLDDLSAASVPTHPATFRQLSDLYLLTEGGYEPVRGFLNAEQTESVCTTMHLPTGEPWSVPVVFPIDAETKARIETSDRVVLMDGEVPAGLLHVEEIFAIRKDVYADNVFRTQGRGASPAWHGSMGPATGPWPELSRSVPTGNSTFRALSRYLPSYRSADSRQGLAHRCRVSDPQPNPPCARVLHQDRARDCGRLVIHPLLGETKQDDTPAEVRLPATTPLLSNYYPADHTLLAGFPGVDAVRRAARGDLPRPGPQELRDHAFHRRTRSRRCR